MDAHAKKLHELLSLASTKFLIPIYQRNYEWGEEQCRQLFEDIVNVGIHPDIPAHFIGSITYVIDTSYSASDVKELTIIDGQQRLTTATLIYIALYWLAKELGKEELEKKIEEQYLTNKYDNSEEKLKLKATDNNKGALKFLLREHDGEDYKTYSRLIENYNFFKKNINEDNLDIIQKGLNKLMYVDIRVERDKDDPQKIYESMNSTGLGMSEGDKIRNSIFMGLHVEDQNKLYKNYWVPIEDSLIIGVSKENKITDFMRDFLTIETKQITSHDSVYRKFKQSFLNRDTRNIKVVKPLLTKLKKYAAIYNKLSCPSNEKDSIIRKHLNYINKLEINVSYPFLIRIYDDYSNKLIDKTAFIKTLELIQSYLIRRFIVGVPYGPLNSIFMTLYDNIKEKQNCFNETAQVLMRKRGTSRFPNDEEVYRALKEKEFLRGGSSTKKRNYLLERLENYENREPVTIEGNNDITVEHIFPQNPDSKWKTLLSEYDFKELSEKYLNTISNLTLSGNNTKLSNKIFLEKRDLNIDQKEQGYKYSRLWLNKHLSIIDKWDVEELSNRYEVLYNRFLQVFGCPDVDLENTDWVEEVEISIINADINQCKHIDYIIFLGKKISAKSLNSIYEIVIREFYKSNPQAFFNKEIKEYIYTTKKKTELSKPLQLNDTYFFEGDFSKRQKLRIVQHILRIFDCQDELIIRKLNNVEEVSPKQLSLFGFEGGGLILN